VKLVALYKNGIQRSPAVLNWKISFHNPGYPAWQNIPSSSYHVVYEGQSVTSETEAEHPHNSGLSKWSIVIELVCTLYFITVCFNFDIKLVHVPGIDNTEAFLLSLDQIQCFRLVYGVSYSGAPTPASHYFVVKLALTCVFAAAACIRLSGGFKHGIHKLYEFIAICTLD
jgi:hypothetical protein